MKNPFLPFLFLSSFFLFTSCEKETINPTYSTQGQGVFSLASLNEVIVFHYGKFDLATQGQSGFIIDKYGNVKSYQLTASQTSKLAKGNHWTDDDAEYLYNLAKTKVFEVGEETMKTLYHKIQPASYGQLSAKTYDDSVPYIQSFHAFRANTEYQTSGTSQDGCGSGSSYHTAITTHTPYLLLMEGAHQQLNKDASAAQIVDWMKGLVVDAGL